MKVFSRVPLDLAQQRIPHGHLFIIPERCKGCKLCVNFCPRHVLEESLETNAKGYHIPRIAEGHDSDCVHCQFCTLICPEFAIFSLEVAA
jgi:2-oxoglutarate ferredoxin oxidoreductase subunit delta